MVQQHSMSQAVEGDMVGRVRVAGFSLSLDGFGAGLEQSLEDPLGKRGTELHRWFVGTTTFRAMFGKGGGSEGVDETFAHRSMDGFGAFILGRNMFGPVRGKWLDDNWKGWWGDNPPYHAPTFVLTHHAREPIVMEGGTTFHFMTDGIHAALKRARDAAGARDASPPMRMTASWSGPQPTYRIQVCGVRYASIASSPRISSSLRVLRRQGAAKHKRR